MLIQAARDTVVVAAQNSSWLSGLVGVIIAAIVSAVASYFGGNRGAVRGVEKVEVSRNAAPNRKNL